MKSNKKTVYLIATLLILLFLGLLYLRWMRTIQTFPTIDDPVTYTKSFESDQDLLVELEVGGLEGRTIISPIFPYSKLKTRWVEAYECPRRYYNVDTVWNLIWVEIANCGERTKFFGPFKWSNPTPL